MGRWYVSVPFERLTWAKYSKAMCENLIRSQGAYGSWSGGHNGPINGVALFSDGLQMLALKIPGGTPHPPFFTPLLNFLACR